MNGECDGGEKKKIIITTKQVANKNTNKCEKKNGHKQKCENTYTTQVIIIKCFNRVMYVHVQKNKNKLTYHQQPVQVEENSKSAERERIRVRNAKEKTRSHTFGVTHK